MSKCALKVPFLFPTRKGVFTQFASGAIGVRQHIPEAVTAADNANRIVGVKLKNKVSRCQPRDAIMSESLTGNESVTADVSDG